MGEPTRQSESLVSIPTAAVEAEQVAYGNVAPDNALLLPGLRRGDESAFGVLIEQYHASMTRLARLDVPNPIVAEEVVQEAWLAVVRGLSGLSAYFAQMQRTVAMLRQLAREPEFPETKEALLQKFREWRT